VKLIFTGKKLKKMRIIPTLPLIRSIQLTTTNKKEEEEKIKNSCAQKILPTMM